MKRLLLLAIAFAAVGTLQAQQDNGGISTEMLNVIRQGQSNSLSEKAARNALALNPIAELATNADNLAMIDTHFSHRVKTKGITDQHQSGRCWLFTGLNVLRAKMIDQYNLPSLEFSQNYWETKMYLCTDFDRCPAEQSIASVQISVHIESCSHLVVDKD